MSLLGSRPGGGVVCPSLAVKERRAVFLKFGFELPATSQLIVQVWWLFWKAGLMHTCGQISDNSQHASFRWSCLKIRSRSPKSRGQALPMGIASHFTSQKSKYFRIGKEHGSSNRLVSSGLDLEAANKGGH